MWPGPMGHGPGLLGARPNYAGLTAPFAGAAGAHFAGPSGFQAAAQPAFASQAGPAQYAVPPSTPHSVPAPAQHLWSGPSHWDPQVLASAYNTAVLTPPPSTEWYMDSGASAHMTSDAGTLSSSHRPNPTTPSHIVVGNGSLLPITSVGRAHLHYPNRSFVLNNVLFSPDIIKSLISARRFSRDNWCSVELDPFGLSVKDYQTKTEIVRCNSPGDLYPLPADAYSSATSARAFVTTASNTDLWHRRLGHLGHEALTRLAHASVIPPPKGPTSMCHACQLGRHVRLPFTTTFTRATANFELIHCDLWTSPIPSVSGFKYYLVILDDCSHFVWTFPLRLKSDTFSTLSHFFAHVKTQFGTTIKSIQCDNGREFDNSTARSFFLTTGVTVRMSCPHTSPQNGKAERMLRSLNNITRSLLFQASLPASYWVEALHTATHLINRHPTKTLHHHTPFFALYGAHPSYSHLRVFGCRCYPNLSATAPHKLAPRSTACVFLGYPQHHKGYRCLDLQSNRIIISRHVVFDESSFPFAEMARTDDVPTNLTFLEDFSAPVQAPIGHPRSGLRGPAGRAASPRPAPEPACSTAARPAAPEPAGARLLSPSRRARLPGRPLQHRPPVRRLLRLGPALHQARAGRPPCWNLPPLKCPPALAVCACPESGCQRNLVSLQPSTSMP